MSSAGTSFALRTQQMQHWWKAFSNCEGDIVNVSEYRIHVLIRYKSDFTKCYAFASSALMLSVGWQEGHPACKKTEWWGAGMVICLERGADLHTAQLMPLPLTVSCFSKIQIGFTFLVPAHPGSPDQRAVKRACVCVMYKTFYKQ